MMNKKWNKEKLDKLYNIEGKTLQEIGDIYNVSRERIRQVMDKVGLVRGHNQSEGMKGGNPYYKTLKDYFEDSPNRIDISSSTLRKFKRGLSCSECGKTRYLHFHHIVYPATSPGDIQILCASCHYAQHRRGITYIKQLEIYHAYMRSETTKSLAQEYKVSRRLIYGILRKIRNGKGALRWDNQLGRLPRQKVVV